MERPTISVKGIKTTKKYPLGTDFPSDGQRCKRQEFDTDSQTQREDGNRKNGEYTVKLAEGETSSP